MPRGVGVRVPLSAQGERAERWFCSFFCAYKVPRTSGSASDDWSAVGSDVPRCNATMGMRRE